MTTQNTVRTTLDLLDETSIHSEMMRLLGVADAAVESGSWEESPVSHHTAYHDICRLASRADVPSQLAFLLGRAAGSSTPDSWVDALNEAITFWEER